MSSIDDKASPSKADFRNSLEPAPTYEDGTITDTAYVLDHKAERKLCRKMDFHLLPILAVMYLFNSLDKGNLGNAKTNTLEKDLHLGGNQYNLILSIFYIPYVLSAPPIGMLGKKFGPHRTLPIMMFSFGSFTLLSVTAHNFGGIMTLRVFLGISEGAFLPLVIHYLTMFYRRGELARRLAVFYAAFNIGSAFSGLLAFGMFQIKDTTLSGWRYLFLLEGGLTVLFSIFAFFSLPASPSKSKFLSPTEKELAYHRIQTDSSSSPNEPFNLRTSLTIFHQPTSWIFLIIDICVGVPLQSVALFLPQIVARLGYSTVKTNLFTVAPNICGAIVLLILAFSSDFFKIRFPFIVIAFLLTFTGMIVYATIDVLTHKGIAYFATFLMVSGIAAPSVILSTWYNNNVPHEGRRVVLTSVGVPVANLMGLVSSNIFLNKDAPKYLRALITTAVFGAVGATVAAALGCWMWWDNRRRDRKLGRKLEVGEVSTEMLRDGPSVESFRWIL